MAISGDFFYTPESEMKWNSSFRKIGLFKSAVSISKKVACCAVVKGVYHLRILQGRQICVKNSSHARRYDIRVRECYKKRQSMYLQCAVYDGVNAILCKWSLYVDTELLTFKIRFFAPNRCSRDDNPENITSAIESMQM